MSTLRENIQQNLVRLINSRNLSQKEFAEMLGVTQAAVTNWVKGKNSPDIEIISKICKLLNINITELIGEPKIISSKKRPMTFSEKLHRKRIEAGMSIEELAEASGIDIEDLKRNEQGLQPNSVVKKIAKLAQILKVEPIELLPDDDRLSSLKLADPGRSFISKPLTSDEKQLLNNYNILNQQGKEKLIDYSDDLVGNSKYTDKQAK